MITFVQIFKTLKQFCGSLYALMASCMLLVLPQEITLISKLKTCTELFNKNKEKRYKMKQYIKTKKLYYKMENIISLYPNCLYIQNKDARK